jgi:hypothetical protein
MIPSELENPFFYKTVSIRKGVAAMKKQMDRRDAEGVKGFG